LSDCHLDQAACVNSLLTLLPDLHRPDRSHEPDDDDEAAGSRGDHIEHHSSSAVAPGTAEVSFDESFNVEHGRRQRQLALRLCDRVPGLDGPTSLRLPAKIAFSDAFSTAVSLPAAVDHGITFVSSAGKKFARKRSTEQRLLSGRLVFASLPEVMRAFVLVAEQMLGQMKSANICRPLTDQ